MTKGGFVLVAIVSAILADLVFYEARRGVVDAYRELDQRLNSREVTGKVPRKNIRKKRKSKK